MDSYCKILIILNGGKYLQIVGKMYDLCRLILKLMMEVPNVTLKLKKVVCKKGFGPGSQEYGYVEVRRGAHMFYWLYYKNTVSEKTAHEHPLVIWLQGGPGASGTGYGNFEEFGTLDKNLKERESAWTKHVNVLFIDNPVGTGFSYVTNNTLFVKNNKEIADDLVKFTKEFYKKFKKFSKTPLYIFSESYGGKMAIEFAYQLFKEIKHNKLQINLKGVALGDSWISPFDSCLTWGPYLLYTGEIDTNGYSKILDVTADLAEAIYDGDWVLATEIWSMLEDIVEFVSNGVSFYNILYGNDDDDSNEIAVNVEKSRHMGKGLMNRISESKISQIMNHQVKEALKSVIPDSVLWGDQSGDVFDHLLEDFMKPVIDRVEKVLDKTNLKVIVYSGQLDLIVDTAGTLNWVNKLKWKGADNWKNSSRTRFMVNGKEEGFIKSYKEFSFYWINRAGHMVPSDNPSGALEMLHRITHFKN